MARGKACCCTQSLIAGAGHGLIELRWHHRSNNGRDLGPAEADQHTSPRFKARAFEPPIPIRHWPVAGQAYTAWHRGRRQRQGAARHQLANRVCIDRQIVRPYKKCDACTGRMVRLRSVICVNNARASARCAIPICPIRSLMDNAAENSVTTQSLIVSPPGFCLLNQDCISSVLISFVNEATIKEVSR